MKKNRLIYPVVGVVAMLFAGFVYAWSILSAPISADFPTWSGAQLSVTFTLCMAFFCLGGMAAGILSKRIEPKWNVRVSALLFLIGFFLCSRVQSLPMLYISYGVICGTASGFTYNSVMNVMPRWFPDRQGLISGALLMGFGASSMIVGSVFTAVTPETTGAWRSSLLIMGILMAAVIFCASFFFRIPREDELPASAAAEAAGEKGLELSTPAMLRRPAFWLFFIWATLLSAVGLVVIAQARGMAHTAAPLSSGSIAFAVGLISVSNGIGRVIFGGLFDKIGRRTTMLLTTISMALGAALLLLSLRGSVVLLVAGFVFIGLGYGGGPTMCASVIKDFFGRENFATNYSVVNINLLVASFASTAAAAIYDKSGSFATVFTMLFAMLAICFVSWLLLKKPE